MCHYMIFVLYCFIPFIYHMLFIYTYFNVFPYFIIFDLILSSHSDNSRLGYHQLMRYFRKIIFLLPKRNLITIS